MYYVCPETFQPSNYNYMYVPSSSGTQSGVLKHGYHVLECTMFPIALSLCVCGTYWQEANNYLL